MPRPPCTWVFLGTGRMRFLIPQGLFGGRGDIDGHRAYSVRPSEFSHVHINNNLTWRDLQRGPGLGRLQNTSHGYNIEIFVCVFTEVNAQRITTNLEYSFKQQDKCVEKWSGVVPTDMDDHNKCQHEDTYGNISVVCQHI